MNLTLFKKKIIDLKIQIAIDENDVHLALLLVRTILFYIKRCWKCFCFFDV